VKLTRVLLVVVLVGVGIGIWMQLEKLPLAEHGLSMVRASAAAEALLARRDIATRRITSAAELFPLPDTDTLLILQRRDTRMPDWQRQALLDWVTGGGRLVINAVPMNENDYQDDLLDNTDIANHDPLLYSLGVTAWYKDSVARRPEVPLFPGAADELAFRFRLHCLGQLNLDGKGCARLFCGEDRWPDYVLFDDGEALRQLELDPQIDLLHRDLYSTPDDDDPMIPLRQTAVIGRGSTDNGQDMLLWLTLGDGDVILLSDLDIFTAARLHHLDHADLLLAMSQGFSAVWWIHSVESPPLYKWLWQRGWPLISAASLLLMLFLWHHIPRRGVMLQPAQGLDRDFTDHFQAASALLWRIGQSRALLEPLRREVLRQLGRHPGTEDPTRRLALASSLSGLSQEDIRDALERVPVNEAELRHLVSLLQLLRQTT
jgi:hypothetical protein